MLHVPNENPDGIKGEKNLIHGRTLNLLPFFLIIKNITYVHLVKTVGLHSCIKSAIIIYENKHGRHKHNHIVMITTFHDTSTNK